jgi:hypothetical protein
MVFMQLVENILECLITLVVSYVGKLGLFSVPMFTFHVLTGFAYIADSTSSLLLHAPLQFIIFANYLYLHSPDLVEKHYKL